MRPGPARVSPFSDMQLAARGQRDAARGTQGHAARARGERRMAGAARGAAAAAVYGIARSRAMAR
jgi:NAD(P)H-hydrate repair Nnr-like enzyme with NAD(P)H-hydrate dehydratase domain